MPLNSKEGSYGTDFDNSEIASPVIGGQSPIRRKAAIPLP